MSLLINTSPSSGMALDMCPLSQQARVHKQNCSVDEFCASDGAAEAAADAAGSPNKYGRRTGTEAGSELSLALLATIREAVASPSPHLDVPMEVCADTLLFILCLCRSALPYKTYQHI